MAFNPFGLGGGYEYDDIFDENFNFKEVNFGALKNQYYDEIVAGMATDPNTGQPIGGLGNLQGQSYAAMKAAFKVGQFKKAQKKVLACKEPPKPWYKPWQKPKSTCPNKL